ncbi:non-heme iron oxygenase ferredoxin subunit [Paraburkholderia sp. UCT2]|uniref:non-heme iron oxygenase ferredoxin subunit n=1 Tax=unclassified Paraburkholderia TaxID=2615204 RepID=UPI001655EA03|nr:non-heme iron oxygenase ferredoxin subunit [Paraburkholderia sp. UCT2]MBC8728752.1 non-heme iron oxygenase ferredoxin subunit [Paraburkholderia sp. UCT2]
MQKWIRLVAVTDVPKHGAIVAEVGNRGFTVFNVDNGLFVTDNICSRGLVQICDGYLDIHELERPFYQEEVKARHMKALCEPLKEDLRIRPTRVDGDDLFVALG